MCGLAGVMGDIAQEDVRMFKELLILNTLRGIDSTGVAGINVKRDTRIFKQALAAPDFLCYQNLNTILHAGQQAIIGHTRAATIGTINARTAHPFEMGDVVGAHNGTIRGWYQMKDARSFDVDSACLIHNIDKYGWDDTFRDLEGAWAVTLYNRGAHTLQIVRNKERPLHIATREDGKVMYWASEAWMLRAIAGRCGIKLDKSIWQPKENVLHTWVMPNDKFAMKVPEPKVRKLEVRQEKKVIALPQRAAGGHQRPHTSHSQKGHQTDSGCSTNGNVKVGRPRVGSIIHICPIEIKRNQYSSNHHLECVMTEEPYCTVRMYGDKKMLDMVLADEECGTVKVAYDSATNYYQECEPYLSCNFGTFTQDITQKEDDEVLVLGPNDRMISIKEWERLTSHGCSVCTSDLFEDDDITWKGDSPICENCHDIARKL